MGGPCSRVGVPRSFVVLGRGWWRCGDTGLELSPPAWGAAHSLAERGVFIYYLWCVGALPGHGGREGAGGRCWSGGRHGGPHWGLTGTSQLCSRPKRGCWQGHCGGRWLREGGWGWGWQPWDHVHVPLGGQRGVLGGCASLWARTQCCLQAFLPLPMQPFSLSALSPPLWPTGAGRGRREERGVPGPPGARLETHFHFYCLLTSLCFSGLRV